MPSTSLALLPSIDTARFSIASAELADLCDDLNAAFIEREDVIRAASIALLAGEHICLLGDPGTGKSAITNALCSAVGGSYFGVLLTKFSVPEEVFGPISLQGLENDQYRRVTAGYLPEAEVGFVDEIFKANSAILNSLLTLVNERVFDNGGQRTRVPLKMLVGASNELPQDESLAALWDRFMLRLWVAPIRNRDALRRLLLSRGEPSIGARLSAESLTILREAVDAVEMPDEVLDVILDLRDALAQEHGITASDRRWRKAIKLVRASAVARGELTACRADVMVLADALWRTPEERAKVVGTMARIVSPNLAAALKFADAAAEMFGRVDLKTAKIGDGRDSAGKVIPGLAGVNEALKAMIAEVDRLGNDDGIPEIRARIAGYQQEIARAARKALGA